MQNASHQCSCALHTHTAACRMHHINAVVHCTHMRNNIGAAWMTSMQQCIARTHSTIQNASQQCSRLLRKLGRTGSMQDASPQCSRPLCKLGRAGSMQDASAQCSSALHTHTQQHANSICALHTHTAACRMHHINAVVHCTHTQQHAKCITSMQLCIAHTCATALALRG